MPSFSSFLEMAQQAKEPLGLHQTSVQSPEPTRHNYERPGSRKLPLTSSFGYIQSHICMYQKIKRSKTGLFGALLLSILDGLRHMFIPPCFTSALLSCGFFLIPFMVPFFFFVDLVRPLQQSFVMVCVFYTLPKEPAAGFFPRRDAVALVPLPTSTTYC